MTLKSNWLLSAPLALAFTVACSSPQPAAPAAPVAPAAASSPAAVAPTATAAPPPPTPTPKPPELSTLLRAAASGYKATYTLKVSQGGTEQMNGTATMYAKPPKARFDMVTKMEGKDTPMSLYRLEDGAFMCTTLEQMKGCFKLGMGQGSAAFDTQQALQDKPDDFEITPKGTRQIAGTTAYCATMKKKSDAAAPASEACYSADGVPLALIVEDKGERTAMEATSFSKTVADADFVLPATPVEMPGMSGMPGMPPGGMPAIPNMPPGR